MSPAAPPPAPGRPARLALAAAALAGAVVLALALAGVGPFHREPEPRTRVQVQCLEPGQPPAPLAPGGACPSSAQLGFAPEQTDPRVPAIAWVLLSKAGAHSLGSFRRDYAAGARVSLAGLAPGPAAVALVSGVREVQAAEVLAAVRGAGDLEAALAALRAHAGELRRHGPAALQVVRFEVR